MSNNRTVPTILVAIGMVLACLSPLALADTVDNPGPFMITSLGGHVKIGSQESDINPADQFLQGEVDAKGNMTIPIEGIQFPDVVVPTPLGEVTVRFVPQSDAAGTLNPMTGDSTIMLSIRFQLIHPLLPPNCGIGPVDAILTTGSSGMLTGEPYDQTTGLATYVNNEFSAPQSTGCGAFGSAIDSFLGLPSDPPNNSIRVPTQTDPIFTGS